MSTKSKLICQMANAFLAWPLPTTVRADPCACSQFPGRTGTNLLSFDEARQMFEAVVAPLLPDDSANILLSATEGHHRVSLDRRDNEYRVVCNGCIRARFGYEGGLEEDALHDATEYYRYMKQLCAMHPKEAP